jgi:catechol 2,3-dioxygenase-like lactoylglutathione lyase family enzyme
MMSQPEEAEDAKRHEGPPTVEGISAVSLVTHDMARSVRFYRTLGFTIRHGGEQASFTSLHAGSGYLNLIARPVVGQRSWWGRVIFYVSDVDGFCSRAVAMGLTPDTTPADAPWGERFFHLTDPEGNDLSVARPLPGATTPEAVATDELTTTPVGPSV